jgi:hypothetical protein
MQMAKRRGHKGGKKLKVMGAHLGGKHHKGGKRGRKHGGKKR